MLIFRIVLFSLFTFSFASAARAEPVFWRHDAASYAGKTPRSKELAVLYKSLRTAAAYPANQSGGTRFHGAGASFPADTYFAVYPRIMERGGERALALAETGQWVFIRTSHLISEISGLTNQEVISGRQRFEKVERVFAVQNPKGVYLVEFKNCNSSKDYLVKKGGQLGAEVGFGLAKLQFGAEYGQSESISVPLGRHVYRYTFLHEPTGELLEIEISKECGIAAKHPNFRYTELYFDGGHVSLRLPPKGQADFPIHVVTGQAVITCQQHYSAYLDFLRLLDVPEIWIETVAALTGSWKDFSEFDQCSNRV